MESSRPPNVDLERDAREMATYLVRHNAQVDLCDFLIQNRQLPMLINYADKLDCSRVCFYLLSCASMMTAADSQALVHCATDLYLKARKPFEALRCAVVLKNVDMIRSIYNDCKDVSIQKQMAILLGRQQIFLELDNEQCAKLNSNVHLYRHFQSLARDLQIEAPKKPADIYKKNSEQPGSLLFTVTDNARMNLAASFVNGFVNCGFGSDTIFNEVSEVDKWFAKNREWACLTAAASQGLIHRWHVDRGLAFCDRFLHSSDDYIRGGTLLAIGIIASGVQDPVAPACAILMDYIKSDRIPLRVSSILGLGLAYVNSKREFVVKNQEGGVIYELKKIFSDKKPSATPEVKGVTALALGFILLGTADLEVAACMLTYLHSNSIDITEPNHRFVALGIALIFLGQQEKCEVTIEGARALPEPFGGMASTLIEVCAYAGTGNSTKVQSLLRVCSEHYDKKKRKSEAESPTDSIRSVDSRPGSRSGSRTGSRASSPTRSDSDTSVDTKKEDTTIDFSTKQAVAVLGIGLIAMGEDQSDIILKIFGHMMRYGESTTRRAVPLAMALISPSNPQMDIMEILAKYAHDSDAETARNAIFALGIVGSGTNNAHFVATLRQLASFHGSVFSKEQMTVMLVRIAQGLIHLGKGTMTLNPFHSDRQLIFPAAVAALFTICFAFLDAEHGLLNDKQHYLLFVLALAVQPRLLITLIEDEKTSAELKPINVSVRVGQAVDVVAQAGRPKTITGFQTHSTPVLLAHGQRAELATDEYVSLTPQMEGLVILKKNPDAEVASTPKKQ
ncbi:26S proteasome non-ATPase regulatory subunit 2 [Ditylenchus destructor]|uniref:26S proteasome non-ATPase regulatory subunit 2 n=1 Tax=Ditylenchus destructor TaxID=166010 RepID=A0AAD4MR28_9BILA|nr:26S proteasome non-ATPase regulatory subunit 2 [Ditylenchus destructor]